MALQNIPVGKLVKDPHNYRTADDELKIKRLTANWHWPSCGVLDVIDNQDGTYGVLEGWHRARTILGLFGPDRMVLCNVQDGLSEEDKISVFLNVNDKKPISSLEKFHARVVRGDADAVEIMDVLNRLKLTMAMHSRMAGHIRNVKGLEDVYRIIGGTGLEQALCVMMDAWPNAPVYYRSVLRGVGGFIKKYPHADLGRLSSKMHNWGSQGKVENAARDRTTATNSSGRMIGATVDVLRDLYNSNLGEGSSKRLS